VITLVGVVMGVAMGAWESQFTTNISTSLCDPWKELASFSDWVPPRPRWSQTP